MPEYSIDLINQFDSYLRRLFPLCRSITGEPNRETLRILQEVIPLKINEIKSGTKVYDWIIPDEWWVRDAWIADFSGKRIVNFQENNLHLVSYSQPIKSFMEFCELKQRLYIHEQLPEAIPYRTSYYKRDWGFCLTYAQYDKLSKMQGPLEVVVDSGFKSGSLSYGEFLLSGESEREILISCYICHPSMANDSLSGVILTAFLAKYLSALSKRKWSYRIIFVPETIGSIAYCATHEAEMKKIDIGLVITTVGGPGPLGYKKTWDSSHWLNEVIEATFKKAKVQYKKYPFDIHGSDERQYSSQGFRINVATISKDRYYEYDHYHTSLDNLGFVTSSQIYDTYKIYIDLICEIESLHIYKNTLPHGEVMLSKHGLYPSIGGAFSSPHNSQEQIDLILWLLFLCDGNLPLEVIAKKIGVDFDILVNHIEQLVAAKIIKEI